jgi:hypothetical protein
VNQKEYLKPMKVIIEELELKQIIEEAMISRMPDLANDHFEVQLIAGRGENGHRAEIEISAEKPEENSPAPKTENAPFAADKEDPVVPNVFGESNDD